MDTLVSQMAFVAIGATMVGSITFTKTEGDPVKKGEEVSLFTTTPSVEENIVLLLVCQICSNGRLCSCSLVSSHSVEVRLFACLKRLAFSVSSYIK